ncbi:MAG: glycosyltransferase family 4 protein [Anaerolineae bacterium]
MDVNLFSPYAPVLSGVVTYSQDLAAALERRGTRVNRVNERLWRSHRLGLPGIYASRHAMRFDRAVTVAMARFFKPPPNSKTAINHFHLSGGLFNYLVAKDYDRVGGKRVVTVHDQNFVTGDPRHPYDECEQLRMLRQADLVIAHTEELKRRLDFINGNIHVIPHGVDCRRFAIPSSLAKSRLGVTGPLVSQIGFLFGHKGITSFIKAAAGVDATIMVAGSGPAEPEIRRLAGMLCPEKVVFRPYVEDEEYPYYIAASDVIVFPRIHSQGECSGVLVQAMAAGKAIVAHNLGCFAEYLAGGRGLLTEPESISELRQAITTFLENAQLRAQYGQACSSYAHDRLAWDHVAAQHVALYEGLASA